MKLFDHALVFRTERERRVWITRYGGSGTGHGWIPETELLNLQKRGQFPDESIKMKDTQIHNVNVPDVLGIGTLKEIVLLETRLL